MRAALDRWADFVSLTRELGWMNRYDAGLLILCIILVRLGALWLGTHHTGWAIFFAIGG